jgi:hypothetical protein
MGFMGLTDARGKRPRVAMRLMLAAGMLVVAAGLTAGDTASVTTRRATVLILGCELLIAALLIAPGRPRSHKLDFPSFIGRCVAETAFGAAIVSAVVIVCFGDSKPVERLGYFAIALVVVPASVVLSRRRSARDPADPHVLEALLPLPIVVVAACAARLSGSTHTSLKLLITLVALRVVAEGTLRLPPARAARARFAASPRGAGGSWVPAVVIASLLLMIGALPFMPGVDVHAGRIGIALLAAVAIGCVAGRSCASSGVLRHAIDGVVVLIAALAVAELHPPDLITALNGNYFLGPTNDVLHGHAMLVGTFSQYGVGMFDVLAGFFSIFPLGYGVMTLLLITLTAAVFAAIYTIVRISTRSQLLGVLCVLVAVTLYVFGQPDFYTGYPSTGALRFGLPWLVILLSVLGAKTSDPRRRRRFDAAVIVLVGLASVWSGETGIYCLGAACMIACLDTAALAISATERARLGAFRLARLLGAYGLGILLFTLITRVAAGHWPQWGIYIDFVRLYTTGGVGAQAIGPWSPGLAIGAEYAVSATVLIGLLVARPETVRARPDAFRAAAGVTAMGALIYTYFLGRSNPINLIHISPPAVALVFIWLGIVAPTLNTRRVARAIAVAAVVFIGGLIVVAQHGNVDQRFGETALGTLLEHPDRTGSAFQTLADNPAVTRGAVVLERFVSSLHIRSGSLTIFAAPAIESEALLRLGDGNAAGTSQPCQEGLSPTAPARARTRVRQLSVGSVLVLGLKLGLGLSAASEAIELGGTSWLMGAPAPIDQYSLALIRDRFDLRVIARSGPGLTAYRLAALKRSWNGGATVPTPPLQLGGFPLCA